MHVLVVESVESLEGIIIWTTEQGDQRNKHRYLSCVLKARGFAGFSLFSPSTGIPDGGPRRQFNS
jgi:hypothetical protein